MKRILSLLLSILMVVSMLPVGALADEETSDPTEASQILETDSAEEIQQTEEPETAEEPEDAEATDEAEDPVTVSASSTISAGGESDDSDELYNAYLQQIFYSNGIALCSENAWEQLDSLSQQLYDYLKPYIQQIAAGSRSEAFFTIDGSTLKQWGLTIEYISEDGSTPHDEVMDALGDSAVMNALLHDCPYDLYWFDKVSGIMSTSSWYYYASSGKMVLADLSIAFAVSKNYRTSSYSTFAPTVNTSSAAEAAEAAANAQAIVAACEDLTDYEKLVAYKDKICSLVTYNTSAASSGNFTTNNNPWQLIYVFDGNTSTNVVCEGYSKAFQYLCDLTRFRGDVSCYSVSGYMVGGTGAGAHMWNIVSIGGKNYMADVTNSDDGTIGKDGSLFLAGSAGSLSSGYTVNTVRFTYDDAVIALWGSGEDSILNLSAESYDPSSAEDDTAAATSGTCGDSLTWSFSPQTGTLTISGTGDMYDALEVWDDYRDSITTVVIEEGVTRLGESAFSGCTALASVTLPDTLTSIQAQVFAGCTSLKSIVLPAGTDTIRSGAFLNCTALETITIGGAAEIYAPFEGCTSMKEITFTGDAPTYCEGAFQDLSCTVYYPSGNETWTEEIQESFGGDIRWIPIHAMSQEDFEQHLAQTGGKYVLENPVILTSDLTIDDAVLNVADMGSITVTKGVTLSISGQLYVDIGGSITVQSGGTLVIDGYAEVWNASLTVRSGGSLILQEDSSVFVAGTSGLLSLESGATLTAESGAITLSLTGAQITGISKNQITASLELFSQEDASLSAYIAEGSAYGSFHLSLPEDFVQTDAVLEIPANTRLSIWGYTVPEGMTLINNGTIDMEGYQLTVNGSMKNNGCIGCYEASQLVVNGSMTGNAVSTYTPETMTQAEFEAVLLAAIQGDGICGLEKQVTLTSDLTIPAEITDFDVVNCGSILVPKGVTLTIEGDMSFYNFSSLTVEKGGQLNIQGSVRFSLYAKLLLKNGAVMRNSGSLILADGASLTVEKGAVVHNHGSLLTQSGSDGIINNYGKIYVYQNDFTSGDGVWNGNDAINVTNYAVTIDTDAITGIQQTEINCGILRSGQKGTLTAALTPGNLSETSITWSLREEDEAYASLTVKNGKATVTAKTVSEQHTVVLTAATADGIAQAAVYTIDICPLVSQITVFLDGQDVTGSTVSFDLNRLVENEDGELVKQRTLDLEAVTAPGSAALSWTSDNKKVASIDGSLTPQATFTGTTGTVKFTGTATDGSGVKVTVTVKAVALTQQLVLFSGVDTLMNGKSATFKVADVSKPTKALAASAVTWSLAPQDAPYASVTAAGKLTAKTVQERVTVTLTATVVGNENATLTQKVTIYPYATQVDIRQDGVTINGQTLFLDVTDPDASLTLTGVQYPLGEVKGDINWSSSSIAKVTNGVVTPVKDKNGNYRTGTATITAAASDDSKKSATIKVQLGIPAASVTIQTADQTAVKSGKNLTLKATVSPKNATNKTVVWSLAPGDEAYASITTAGKLTAKTVYEAQTVTAIATSKDGYAVSSIIVRILPASDEALCLITGSKNVTKTTYTVNMLDEAQKTFELSAFLCSSDGSQTVRNVTWSTSSAGTASLSAKKGETVTVTMKAAKSATITATGTNSKGKTVTATVTVKGTNLSSGVTISSAGGFTVASGKSLTLKASVSPSSASNKAVTWSLAAGDSAYATLSSSGKLTAKANLTEPVTVTVSAAAKDGSCTASQTIQILPLSQGLQIHGTDGELTNTTLTVDLPTPVAADTPTLTVSAKVFPASAAQNVTWNSSNAKIAKIDQAGRITCLKTGTVTITATAKDSGKKATFKLTVVEKMESLTLAQTAGIAGGKNLTLKPVIGPSNTTNQKLVWSMEGDTAYATLSSSGILKTKAVTGKKTVTVTARSTDGSGLSASCTVTIYPKTTKVQILNGTDTVTGKTLTLKVGETLTLSGVSTPAQAMGAYQWSSSSSAYVSVTNGVITAVKAGKTITITCTAADGSGQSAKIKIKVVK